MRGDALKASAPAVALGATGLITFGTLSATMMQALDTTIANVALPHMQGSLSASQEQVAWVLTSYIVASAIATTPTGYLANRYGVKRIFLIAVAGFTIASMLCGIASSLTEIVFFRLLQGIFGAALVPLSQTTLLDTYPPEKQGSAMAAWGVGRRADAEQCHQRQRVTRGQPEHDGRQPEGRHGVELFIP